MSFKYIDPGYGWGVTSPVNVYKSNVYNPRNGVAFSLSENDYQKKRYTGIRGKSTGIQGISESLTDLWLMFDIFLPENLTGTDTALYVDNGGNRLLTITQNQAGTNSSICIVKVLNDSTLTLNESNGSITNLKKGAVNTVWIHVTSEDYEWSVAVAVNGEYIFNNVSSDTEGTLYSVVSFRISPEQPISNLIISDEEIDLKEVIVAVGNSSIETTMVENGDIYSSAQAGDYVLQALDTKNLYNRFGAEGNVLGMVAIAVPAYTTGEDVTQIKCRIDDGETVTDYRIQDPATPFETDASLTQYSNEEFAALENKIPAMGRQIAFESDTTFADLNGLKVGWVTA